MTPLEPQKKVLVSEDFLKTEHGEIDCHVCHGGDPEAGNKLEAHKGFDPTPSANDPESACGDCHEDIVKTAKDSLHATLSTFSTILKSRAAMEKWPEIDKGREKHCASCHTSCGGCHVSRPSYVGRGFVAGHNFNSRPDPMNQCTACHGSRVGNEFYGMRGQGDVHLVKYNMGCVSCHTDEEMHAAAPEGLKGRYHLEESVDCEDCHKDLKYGSVRDHEIHIDKVQCQVCHSQSYTNCYSCHTGTDPEGIPYFINRKDIETMKIGLNYDVNAPGAKYRYMLVRHVPVDPDVFDHYTEDAFANFSNIPTWKRTSPHNIQRKTWQNATCNNCHGNRGLFLSKHDLLDYEIEANQTVVISDKRLPKPIERTRSLNIDSGNVRSGMVVDVRQLKEKLDDPRLIVVDARNARDYEKEHIPGAILLDPLVEEKGLRWPWNSEKPMQLVNVKNLAEIFGSFGIGADDAVVVYDEAGQNAGFLLSVLDYAGATDISFLKGGIGSWKEAGYPTSKTPKTLPPKAFEANAHTNFIVDNDFVLNNLDNPEVAIVDVRILQQAKAMVKHPRASRAGRVPGSVKLPVFSLYMDHARLKSPEELLWVLKSRRITPDKRVIVTCNTGMWAGASFFIFRYLGYPDVRVHDESWVGWCAAFGADQQFGEE